MDASTAPSADLARAAAAFAELLELVGEDDWDASTPCSEWTVAQLVAHVIEGNARFTALLGRNAFVRADPEPADGSLREQFLAGVPAMLSVFDDPGALHEPVGLPIGTVPGSVALHARLTDVLVHAWDLARALGAATSTLPEDLAGPALEFVMARRPVLPPGRFGPAQPCPVDASALDRLAAELGRTV